MGFELTKLLAGLLMPLPLILVLLILGLVLSWMSRFRRLGMSVIAAGTTLLLLVSIPPISERALLTLEAKYPPLLNPPGAEWIVVLGGGRRDSDSLPPASRLAPASIYRLAEGVRLHRLLPHARLLLSGGGPMGELTTAEAMAQVAKTWGVEPGMLVLSSEPLTTAEEAQAVANRVANGDRIILVTSAFHMYRAMVLFEAQGLAVIPAPAGNLVDPDGSYRHIGGYLPQSEYIEFAEHALWERIGLLWAWLREDV